MKANINDNPLRIVTIPKGRYKRPNGDTVDGYEGFTQFHFKDGFRDVIIPEVETPETHELGELIIQGNEITYTIVEKSILDEVQLQHNADQQKKETRNQLLKNGVTVSDNGFSIWFNEQYLSNFIVYKRELKDSGAITMNWKMDDGEWDTISMVTADKIALQGMELIQEIYINN